MIDPQQVALVLLAAGHSHRFGAVDKLAEPFLDKPLAYHVVTALEAIPFMTRIAIVSDTVLDFGALRYEVVQNPDPTLGQARSVCHGVKRAQERGAQAVLIALADMPRVTAGHVYRLFDAFDGAHSVVASSDGVKPMPPALFGKDQFDELLALEGDQGARDLIRGGKHVVTSPAELIDIDTQDDLRRLRETFGLKTDHVEPRFPIDPAGLAGAAGASPSSD
jgi:molybdenum cofactor cytidylyltransferase